MKREIKFKAWDDEAKTMIYSDEKDDGNYWWEIYPLKCGYISGETGGNQFEPPEPIVTYYEDLMQYTGLKDKNGKEIYEGDIIITDGYVYEVFYHLSLGWDGGGNCHPGFYLKGRAEKIDEDYSDLDYHIGFNDCEVIGNIYENPVSK